MPILQPVSFSNTPDPQEADIARRLALANSLQQQAMNPGPEIQKSGNIVVGPSWTSGLARMLSAYQANKVRTKAEAEKTKLAEDKEARRQADMSLMVNALRGRPAEAGGLSEDASGNVTQMPAQPAMTPVQSLQQAIPMMAPQMQQVALPIMLEQQKEAQRAQEHADTIAQRDRALAAKNVTGAHQFAPSQLGKLIAERDALPEGSPLRQAYDSAIKIASQAQERNPSYQLFPTPQGPYAFDRRSGAMTPAQGGAPNNAPLVPPSADPALQADIAAQRKAASTRAGVQAQASVNLPQVIAKADQALTLIDQMIGKEGDKTSRPHPGFHDYVGFTWKPGARFIEGSNAANFQAMHNQLIGKTFLEAYETLKGGGQITEIEGRKATEALTRMSKSQSEGEYISAARELQQTIRAGVERAKQRAAGGAPSTASGWAIKPVP